MTCPTSEVTFVKDYIPQYGHCEINAGQLLVIVLVNSERLMLWSICDDQ